MRYAGETMPILDRSLDEFRSVLAKSQCQLEGEVAALYRKSASGGYVPVFWTPSDGEATPPFISSASDLAAYLRAEEVPAFSINAHNFKDARFHEGMASFNVSTLLVSPVRAEKPHRYYLTVGISHEPRDADLATMVDSAREVAKLLEQIMLQAKVRDESIQAKGPSAPARPPFEGLAWDLLESALGRESFDAVAQGVAKSLDREASVLVEDANGRMLACTPPGVEVRLSLEWLLAPPRLPYLDKLEEQRDAVIVPAAYDERGRGRIIAPLYEQGEFLGAMSVLDALAAISPEILLAARFSAIHLLRRREASRSRILRDSLNSVENERVRVAFELHDETSQNLVALKVCLSNAKRSFALGKNGQAAGLLDDCSQIADEILDGVNRLSADLRPSELNYLGLQQAIDAAATARLGRIGMIHEFTGNALDAHFNALQETMLLSGVVEALANCAKHSEASRVSIELDDDGTWFTIAVRDDGRGFDVSSRSLSGYGIKAMSDCSESIGGDFWIGSVPGKGTTVRFSIPVRLLEEV